MVDGELFLYVVQESAFVGDFGDFKHLPGLCLVSFSEADLATPSADPIGLYWEYGDRRYIWKDYTWAEFQIPVADILIRLKAISEGVENENFQIKNKVMTMVRRMHKLLNIYVNTTSFGVMPQGHHITTYCRAIYRINTPPRTATDGHG